MNKEWLEQSIKSLSDESLYKLFRDVERRIGSHVLEGDPVPEYVQRQQVIADMVVAEMERRKWSEGVKRYS